MKIIKTLPFILSALFFFSCADILRKQNSIQIAIPPVHDSTQAENYPPPLATTNNFISKTHFNNSARASAPLPKTYYAVCAFLCKPIYDTYDGTYIGDTHDNTKSETGAPFVGSLDYPSDRNATPHTILQEALNNFQKTDPNQEIICFTMVNNFDKTKGGTISLPPITIGTEFFFSGYLVQFTYADSYPGSESWISNIVNLYWHADHDPEFGKYISKPIIANDRFQEISITPVNIMH